MKKEEKSIVKSLKCLYNLRNYIYDYYEVIDTTHIIDIDNPFVLSFEENDTMRKKGEQSINVISALLIDALLNNTIDIEVNDLGNIPSKSDMKLSSGKFLEMKRVPIGTQAYDKGYNRKYKNVEPIDMTIEDSFEYINDKVLEYSDEHLNNKQRANYIGFYFAVSNLDLYQSSVEDLYKRFYKGLKDTLNVFEDVFLIFNKISTYKGNSEQNIGETVCLSLKLGKYNSIYFDNIAAVEEDNIVSRVINDLEGKHIVFQVSNIKGNFHLIDGMAKGVYFDREEDKYGFSNNMGLVHSFSVLGVNVNLYKGSIISIESNHDIILYKLVEGVE